MLDSGAGSAVFTGGFLAPGGRLFAMASVAEQWPGRAYLRLLHRAGEVASPRRLDEMREAVASGLDAAVDGAREGSMAFLTARFIFRQAHS